MVRLSDNSQRLQPINESNSESTNNFERLDYSTKKMIHAYVGDLFESDNYSSENQIRVSNILSGEPHYDELNRQRSSRTNILDRSTNSHHNEYSDSKASVDCDALSDDTRQFIRLQVLGYLSNIDPELKSKLISTDTPTKSPMIKIDSPSQRSSLMLNNLEASTKSFIRAYVHEILQDSPIKITHGVYANSRHSLNLSINNLSTNAKIQGNFSLKCKYEVGNSTLNQNRHLSLTKPVVTLDKGIILLFKS